MERDFIKEIQNIIEQADTLKADVEESNARIKAELEVKPATKADIDSNSQKIAAALVQIVIRIDDLEKTVAGKNFGAGDGAKVNGLNGEDLAQIQDCINELRMDLEEMHAGDGGDHGAELKGLVTELREMKKDILDAVAGLKGIDDAINEMKDEIKEKPDKKPFIVLNQRINTVFLIATVGMVGSIMTLGLLGYLIFALAR